MCGLPIEFVDKIQILVQQYIFYILVTDGERLLDIWKLWIRSRICRIPRGPMENIEIMIQY